jgi:hypothetical protein
VVIAYNNDRNINIILSNVISLALKIKSSKKSTGRRQSTLSAYCIFWFHIWLTLRLWRRRQNFIPKRLFTCNRLYGVAYVKVSLLWVAIVFLWVKNWKFKNYSKEIFTLLTDKKPDGSIYAEPSSYASWQLFWQLPLLHDSKDQIKKKEGIRKALKIR